MVNSCIVLAVVAVCLIGPTMSQIRPSYYPRPGGFSQVLPQYENNGDTVIADRINISPPPPVQPGMSNSLDDTQLTDRVQNWPREQQPFWYINAQHIAQHTAQRVPCIGQGCPPIPPAPQSSFLGSGRR